MTFAKGVDPARGREQSTAWSSLIRGWFPCTGAVLGENAQGKASQHIDKSLHWSRAPRRPLWQALSGHTWRMTQAVELPPPARGPGTLIPSAQRLVWATKIDMESK